MGPEEMITRSYPDPEESPYARPEFLRGQIVRVKVRSTQPPWCREEWFLIEVPDGNSFYLLKEALLAKKREAERLIEQDRLEMVARTRRQQEYRADTLFAKSEIERERLTIMKQQQQALIFKRKQLQAEAKQQRELILQAFDKLRRQTLKV